MEKCTETFRRMKSESEYFLLENTSNIRFYLFNNKSNIQMESLSVVCRFWKASRDDCLDVLEIRMSMERHKYIIFYRYRPLKTIAANRTSNWIFDFQSNRFRWMLAMKSVCRRCLSTIHRNPESAKISFHFSRWMCFYRSVVYMWTYYSRLLLSSPIVCVMGDFIVLNLCIFQQNDKFALIAMTTIRFHFFIWGSYPHPVSQSVLLRSIKLMKNKTKFIIK